MRNTTLLKKAPVSTRHVTRDLDFVYFLARLAALVVLTFAIALVARADSGFDRPMELTHDEDYPNAIRITAEDLNTMMIGNDPYDILNYLSLKTGLTFRSTGDFGAEDWFVIRGFGRDNSRLTLVLLDGQPINLASNHTVEFGDIPISLIQEIVIYPGPVPARYGGFQFVVDIRTRKNEQIAEASASVGSLNTYRMNATVANEGRLYYRANMDAHMSEGQTGRELIGILDHYSYSDRFDRAVIPSLLVGYELSPDLDISFRANYLDVKKHFGTELHHGQEQSRERTSQLYSLSFEPGRGSDLDYNLTFFFQDEEEYLNVEFPEDTLYYVGFGTQDRQKFGIRGYYRHDLMPGRLWLKAGGDAQWTTGSVDNEDYLYFMWEDEQQFYAAFMEAGMQPWEGALLRLGGRMDGQSYIDDIFFSPNIALSQMLMEDQLQVYAAYGMSSRWLPLNMVNNFNRPPRPLGPPFLAGNINLPVVDPEMERFTGFDAGLRTTLWDGRVTARVNYYYLVNEGTAGAPLFEIRPAHEDAELPPDIEAAPVAYSRNLPGQEVNEGIEFHVDFRPTDQLRVFANASYTIYSETEIDDDIQLYQGPIAGPDAQAFINEAVGEFIIPYAGQAVIPGKYEWLVNLAATYRFDQGAMLNLNLRYRSETEDPLMKFGMDPQVETMDAMFVTDVGASYPLMNREGINIQAVGRVSNLFDSEYSTFVHYPMVGRFVSLGFEFRL